MLSKTFSSPLCGWQEIQELVFHLATPQNSNQVIKAVLHQIFIEEVCYKREHYPFGNKIILKQWLEDSLYR